MRMKTPMEETMQALDASKDIELPMDPAYYDRLHDRIMAAVDQIESRPPAPPRWYARPQTYLQSHWRSWLALGGGLSGFVLMAQLGSLVVAKNLHQSHAVVAAQQEDLLFEEVLNSPDALSRSLLVSQTESEFFVDVASGSFENLSNDQIRHIVGEDVN